MGIKIARRNINNVRYADDTTLMAETKELNSILKEKEESEKAGLKLNIQKTKIMASGFITSCQIDGEQWKQCQTFFFWAPKSLQMVIAAMKLKDAYSLEARLQQYVNRELPDVQAGSRKGRGTRDQHLLDHGKSKRVPEKHLFLLY